MTSACLCLNGRMTTPLSALGHGDRLQLLPAAQALNPTPAWSWRLSRSSDFDCRLGWRPPFGAQLSFCEGVAGRGPGRRAARAYDRRLGAVGGPQGGASGWVWEAGSSGLVLKQGSKLLSLETSSGAAGGAGDGGSRQEDRREP